MTLYNFTDEQRQKTVELLIRIQMHLPWKTERCACEHMNSAILGIYDILDMVHHQSNQPERNYK